MPLYMLVKVDFGHRQNIGLFDSQAKAEAVKASMEIGQFESGGLDIPKGNYLI